LNLPGLPVEDLMGAIRFRYTLQSLPALAAGMISCGGEQGPTQPGALSFAAVSAGDQYSCGVTTVGAAYCWGENFLAPGVLGDGTRTQRLTPVLVAGGLTFAAVSAASQHTCGVTTAGAAYCWGLNRSGSLGDGTLDDGFRLSPGLVVGGVNFAALSVGGDHACGVTAAGAAYCWGSNWQGQAGDGTALTSRSSPVPVTGGLTFAAVSAGETHTCGVTIEGTAYCWGYNTHSQLGEETRINRSSPEAPVAGGLTFTAVSAGSQHTCGVTVAVAAYCWGANDRGQLGDGAKADQWSPVPVAGAARFTAVSAGFAHTCGVTTTGATYCWGANDHGQLGNGTTTDASGPVRVAGGVRFAAVSAGRSHTCGVTAGGVPYCWGENRRGQLGDGTTTDRHLPVRVAQ
jgi:alpha-tubulin suppressor-like RCC1 family protein